MSNLTLGRIVHYQETPSSHCQTAIVIGGPYESSRTLVVLSYDFPEGDADEYVFKTDLKFGVREAVSGFVREKGASWHWPEREAEE
jgi:hypothetical protein